MIYFGLVLDGMVDMVYICVCVGRGVKCSTAVTESVISSAYSDVTIFTIIRLIYTVTEMLAS